MKTKEQKLKELAARIKATEEFKTGFAFMAADKDYIEIASLKTIFKSFLPPITGEPVEGLLVDVEFKKNIVYIKVH